MLLPWQHQFVTEFNERAVRVQIKDQLDRMKREVRYIDEPLSDEEGGSLDPPTVRKQGEGEGGTCPHVSPRAHSATVNCICFLHGLTSSRSSLPSPLSLSLLSEAARPSAAMSPTRVRLCARVYL